jgi:uroporphyrinogen III methyltransferase / synthase
MSVSCSRPLLNKVIFAACSTKKMADLSAGLEALGGCVVPLPVIEAIEIEDKRPLDKAIFSLEKYSWIIFTSAYGVAFFVKRLNQLGIHRNKLTGRDICAVGPATAGAMKEYGFDATLIPEVYVAEGVIQALDRRCGGIQKLAGHRILLPRALDARDVLPNALINAGALVDVVPCYHTQISELEESTIRQLHAITPDLIVFTSSSAVKNLLAILGQEYGKKLFSFSTVAVLGPITAKTVESFGKTAEILPKENTVASLLGAIREFYGARASAPH